MYSICVRIYSYVVRYVFKLLILYVDWTVGMKKEDVIATLQYQNVLQYYRGGYVLVLTSDIVTAFERAHSTRTVRIDRAFLKWTPRDWAKRGRW